MEDGCKLIEWKYFSEVSKIWYLLSHRKFSKLYSWHSHYPNHTSPKLSKPYLQVRGLNGVLLSKRTLTKIEYIHTDTHTYQHIQNSKRSEKVQVCRQHCNHSMFIANPQNLLNKTMPCLMNQCWIKIETESLDGVVCWECQIKRHWRKFSKAESALVKGMICTCQRHDPRRRIDTFPSVFTYVIFEKM